VEVAKATGVSESSVRRIIRETKNIKSGASISFSTPHKERHRKSPHRWKFIPKVENCAYKTAVTEKISTGNSVQCTFQIIINNCTIYIIETCNRNLLS
jgi:hypothetical protein